MRAPLELRVPIFSMLTADGSVRYDHYGNQDVGGGDSKATYKLGLEFRPIESLLIRGNYATAFRAPDMAYTFGGQSGFFQSGLTDYYRCATVQPAFRWISASISRTRTSSACTPATRA